MKKVSILVLCLIMTAFLAHCGSSDSKDNTDNGGSNITDPSTSLSGAAKACTSLDDSPFKDSCLKDAISCFLPSGSCESVFDVSKMKATVTWESGEKMEVNAKSTTDVSGTAKSKGGESCYTYKVVNYDSKTGVNTTEFTSKDNKKFDLTTDKDGNMTLKCPDGKEEKYTKADLTCTPGGTKACTSKTTGIPDVGDLTGGAGGSCIKDSDCSGVTPKCCYKACTPAGSC